MSPDAPASILVVDDAPSNLQAVTAALGDIADEVVTATSGHEALRQLLDRDFAVVLLDVSMPGMDGYETANLIRSRERNRHVPIIFVTAFDRDHRDVLRAYELGAVDFLFKPLQPELLRAKVMVFVELQRRSVKLALQAERLRELERREHQQELEAQRRELEAAAVTRQMEDERRTARRLAELDRRKDYFLAMLGHELRTPLAAMVAGVEVAFSPEAALPVRTRAREALDRQLEHLVRLVDDLLDVTRIGSGRIELERENVLLDELVGRAIDLARPAIDESDHTLTLMIPSRPVYLDVDPARIVQAISNLLHNAARYTAPGGQITVKATRDARAATISVQDNGRGLSPRELDAVFDIFVRRAHGNEGLGLGLPLARTLAELHGGTLVAYSDGHGCGARFDITLPLRRAGAPGRPPSARPGESPARDDATGADRPLRILVIEDSDDLRTTLCDLLTTWGHRVDQASAGEPGLRALLDTTPDLALVDIGLPDIDGCEVAKRCRAGGNTTTHLVALTGFTQADDRRRIAAAGFDDLFPKPPDLTRLRNVLCDCVRNNP